MTGIGSASLPSLGAVMMNVDLTQPEDPNNNNPLGDYKGTISFAFNRLDSFDVSVDIPNGNGNPAPITGKITGGKGAYQGATGSVTVDITVAPDGNSVVVTGSGTITTAATGVPVITDVSTAFGNSEIAPNTWMVIKGTNLVPSNTHA